MQPSDFDSFARVLDAAYSLHSKSLTADARSLFFAALGEYSLSDVRKAFSAHIKDPQRGQFPPKPADLIAQLSGDPLNDGRPAADEAWVTALAGANEFESVRWTTETAEAMNDDVKRLLERDEIGARMAFKETYKRLCAEARAAKRSVEWVFSWGFDRDGREQLARVSVEKGLLSLPAASAHAPLLAAPQTECNPAKAAECKARIAQILGTMPSQAEKLARAKTAAAAADRSFLESLKADTQRRVDDYERSHA
ncbi:hypothetical protein IAG25_35510 [Caballeronia sp. EK]|uniref:hypothetical protein n=1 Tax=Caballeronia sp. EK TaxID=2767469 RepID=UPI0016560DC2|nr:hypothetical protein [Caballeronia sp. EK]MBC8642115.1 hypothetical protein [Caballeronia sp. EK]